MKNILLKSALLLSLAIGLLSGCANDDHYITPNQTLVTYELTTTRTVASLLPAGGIPTAFIANDIIEAYVTSSDEKGTFYKSISFQTIPTDASAPIGFSVPIDVTTLYGKGFTPGRKVYIQLNGLYAATVYGSLQIGSLYNGTIGRISVFDWQKHLFPSATIVPESAMVRTMSLATAYDDANQNTLVELDEVQFSEGSINRTYYDIDSGGGATNHTLVSSAGGPVQIIRFSSFCPFTGKQVPKFSGKIRGVLTKYTTTFQFIVRYESDIQLTLPRFDVSPPIVGGALVYGGTLNEPFTSYAVNQTNFPKYINDALVGGRYWRVRTFSGAQYLEMSSFTGASGIPVAEANKSAFIVPVDLTAASNFSFKTQSGFDNGSPLKVYYSTNYVPGGPITNAMLVDITSSFNIPNGPGFGYATTFTASGNYAIPVGLTGNGYFIFIYEGNGVGGVTTTMRIDDISIN